MGDGRVGAPDDHELGPVADLAERRRARADRLVGRVRGASGVDHRADRLGERHGPALRLAARLAQAVDERRTRPPQDRGRGVDGLVEAHRAPVDAGDRRPVAAALGEPRVAERARSQRLTLDHLDVVARAAAPRAGRVSHPPPPPRAAPPAAARLARSSPATTSSGVAAVSTTVQTGRPAAMRSPGCGTSRTPRSSQRSVSPTVTSSVAKRTALPAARDAARRRRRADARRTREFRTRPRSLRATPSGAG